MLFKFKTCIWFVLVALLSVSLSAQNLKLEKTIPLSDDADVQFTAISPKGDFIAGACKDGRVRVWSFPAGALKQTFDLKDQAISGVWFSDDGSLLAAGGARGLVRIWSMPTAKLKAEFSAGADIAALAFSPDRSFLVVAPAGQPAQFWDLAVGRMLTELTPKFAGSLALAFSPDGQWLATADADTGIRLYDGHIGMPRTSNDDLLLESFGIAFSADSKTLYVGGADKTISAIDVATNKIERSFPKQKFVVAQLERSHDGKSLVAAYFDENSFRNPAPVILWDTATGTARVTIQQSGLMPNGGGWVADGRLLITNNAGGRLQVWSVK